MIKHGVVVNRLGALSTRVRPHKNTQKQKQVEEPKLPPVIVIEQEPEFIEIEQVEQAEEVVEAAEVSVVFEVQKEIPKVEEKKFEEKKKKKKFIEVYEQDREFPPPSSLTPPPEPQSFEQSQKPKHTTGLVDSWKKRT